MKRYFILPFLFLSCIAMAQGDKNFIDQDKDLLLDLLQLIKISHDLNGFIDEENDISALINEVESQELSSNVLFKNRNDFRNLRIQVDEMLQESQYLYNFKAKTPFVTSKMPINSSEPERLPACDFVTPTSTHVALGAKSTALTALSAAKYTCLESVLGENVSAVCVPLEIAAQATISGYDFAEFCSREGVYAFDFNTFETIKDLVNHMNVFIDDTKVSSRATATSTATLQNSLDDANTNINDAFPIINNNLNSILTGLDQSNQQADNINAQASSLLQRVQVNQIEIEGIAITTSDVQQLLIEDRIDTQALITALTNTQNSINTMSNETQSLLKKIENSQIEFVLARNPASANLIYQIPAFKGGLLDRAREILVRQLSVIESNGGNSVAARKLFDIGNSHYNNQEYKAAYTNYSLAYKALLESKF